MFYCCTHLKENFSAHGFAVSDDGLLIAAFAVPAIQFDTAAAGQKCLPIHFDRRFATELSAAQVGVVGGVDVVMGQGLIHFHVNVQPIQKDGRVVVGHQVADEPVFTQPPCRRKILVRHTKRWKY